VSSWRQCNLRLSKGLDFIPHDIDASCTRVRTRYGRVGAHKAHRSSEAFSSSTPSLYAEPRSWCARQWMLVVLPIPGIPYGKRIIDALISSKQKLTEIMMCGQLPSRAITFSRSMVSLLPTTSSRTLGRYFSTLCIAQSFIQ
jgi:hypothetical protein